MMAVCVLANSFRLPIPLGLPSDQLEVGWQFVVVARGGAALETQGGARQLPVDTVVTTTVVVVAAIIVDICC